MSRATRLLDLLQALRRHRRPVTAASLAAETGVSRRTIYRDIASLQAQGATIAGEAGIGYVLQPGLLLPPLMFSPDEIDAVLLGLRLVADRADPGLGRAADNAAAKITAVLPADRRDAAETTVLMAGPAAPVSDQIDVGPLRAAIRAERKITLSYCDGEGAATERVVWPIALSMFNIVRVLIGWCELRQDFRHFRTDRIVAASVQEARIPRRRAALLREWRAANLG